MNGTNRNTGKPLSGLEHLRQSVIDILTTPLGSRVMRPTYGSRLFELIDSPISPARQLEFFAATAEALRKWEPRLKVQRVSANATTEGRISITVESKYLPTGEDVYFDGIIL